MTHLLLTVFSIVLMASAAVMAVSHSPAGLSVQIDTKNQVERGLRDLEQGWNAYRLANREWGWVCAQHTTATGSYEHCERQVVDQGWLPQEGWQEKLTPAFVLMPRLPQGMNLSYTSNSDGVYFCLSGAITELQYRGLQQAARSFSPQAYFINKSCGAKSSLEAEGEGKADIAVTYWIEIII